MIGVERSIKKVKACFVVNYGSGNISAINICQREKISFKIASNSDEIKNAVIIFFLELGLLIRR